MAGDDEKKYKSGDTFSINLMFTEIPKPLPPRGTNGRRVTIFSIGILFLFLLMLIIHMIEGKSFHLCQSRFDFIAKLSKIELGYWKRWIAEHRSSPWLGRIFLAELLHL